VPDAVRAKCRIRERSLRASRQQTDMRLQRSRLRGCRHLSPAMTPDPRAAGADDSAPASDPPEHPRRSIRSFVLRAGRMGSGQVKAMETLGPLYVLPYKPGRLDFEQAFGRRAPTVLEIGFGMGDATAQIAAARPQDDFIGIEVHTPGVGALLQRIQERGLANLRLLQHDAVEVLRDMIAPGSLAGIHVYFPDPWHKKKHNKRRLIQAPFVQELASRLAPGGYLHCATDWQPYAEQMLQVLGAEPMLANSADGYAPRPDWRPLTKFENRGIKLGHGVWDLVFMKR
jgi:tRNA (guanine-N7-)-methyltransferase